MSYRGRGRSGRFNSGVRYAEKIEFKLFPEIADLPDVNDVKEERVLLFWSHRLQMSWKLSPYYYKGADKDTEGSGSIDIERYSDKNIGNTKHKASLSDCIKMTDAYVPAELAVRHQRSRKRARWTQESDLQKLDIFEQLEKKSKTTDDKKEGNSEEDDDDIIEEEDEEFSDDGDYNKNEDFDDDDDDFNPVDDNDDEPIY